MGAQNSSNVFKGLILQPNATTKNRLVTNYNTNKNNQCYNLHSFCTSLVFTK